MANTHITAEGITIVGAYDGCYCPTCGSPAVTRTRCKHSSMTCTNKHSFLSADARTVDGQLRYPQSVVQAQAGDPLGDRKWITDTGNVLDVPKRSTHASEVRSLFPAQVHAQGLDVGTGKEDALVNIAFDNGYIRMVHEPLYLELHLTSSATTAAKSKAFEEADMAFENGKYVYLTYNNSSVPVHDRLSLARLLNQQANVAAAIVTAKIKPIQALKDKAREYPTAADFIREFYTDSWSDEIAFGYKPGLQEVDPQILNIKWQDDWDNAWVFDAPVEDLPPIDVVYENNKLYVEDGHHRLKTALAQNKPIKIDLTIHQSPFTVLGISGDKDLKAIWEDAHAVTSARISIDFDTQGRWILPDGLLEDTVDEEGVPTDHETWAEKNVPNYSYAIAHSSAMSYAFSQGYIRVMDSGNTRVFQYTTPTASAITTMLTLAREALAAGNEIGITTDVGGRDYVALHSKLELGRFVKEHKLVASAAMVDDPFFDPNSTANEGRKRLIDPQEFDSQTFRRWTRWAGVEAPAGVTFITGTLLNGKRALQTIRFDKKHWTTKDAKKYFNTVVNTPGFEKQWVEKDWVKQFPAYEPKPEDYMSESEITSKVDNMPQVKRSAFARQVISGSPKDVFNPLKDADNVAVLATQSAAFLHQKK